MGPKKKRLRDVRKIFAIVSSRKTYQEENEELNAINLLADSATGGIRTHTPLHYTCAL
jgi:hypothetical protein